MMEEPALYAYSNQPQKLVCREALKQYEKQINSHENEIVMDIGCGAGDVTVELLLPILSPSVKQLLATDKSRAMIDYAAVHYSHPKVAYSQFELTVSEVNETADLITSFSALHWIPDQQEAFRNIYGLLKPGGHCLLVFMAKHPWTKAYEKLSTDPIWGKYLADWERYTPPNRYDDLSDSVAECKTSLEQAGFVGCTVEGKKRHFGFENEDNVKDFVESVDPFKNRIEEIYRENFVKATVSAILGNCDMNKENNYRMKWNSLVAYAKKPTNWAETN